MNKPLYKRGRYNKLNPKEKKITFLSDKKIFTYIRELSEMNNRSKSQIIRDAIQEYYCKSIAR